MGFVDETAIVVGCAIGLVGSEIEICIIAPGVVAVKFHYGQQLDGVDAKPLQIVEFINHSLYRAIALGCAFGAGEIPYKQFIYHQPGLVYALEIVDLPLIIRWF